MTGLQKILLLVCTHGLVAALGFAAGIYFLPLLTAPEAPDRAAIAAVETSASYTATFSRDLKGSDFLHWGEGKVYINGSQIALDGELSPGPDYKLYLAPALATDEDEFQAIKGRSLRIGDVKTFRNFVLPLPPGADPADYKAVVIWCEAFGEFITAGLYR